MHVCVASVHCPLNSFSKIKGHVVHFSRRGQYGIVSREISQMREAQGAMVTRS